MSQTILVVDDIAANRNLLGATLEPKGYEVLLAPNGAAALKVATRTRPHLILMDVNMPEMDGYQACQQLKSLANLAEIPVIFITANDDPESLVKGFLAGGVDYITKPFREREVLMRVETHLKIYSLAQALERSNQELAAKNIELQSEVLRRTEAEEKATEANQAKSRFLSFISHEMRSPLNVIIGFSDELIETLTSHALAQSREDATRIRTASGHLLGLINNLLDLSKIEAGKMPLHLEEIELIPFLEELVKDVEPLVRRNGNQLRLEPNGAIGTIRVDSTKLRQVLLNLISNAAKFTSQGQITVRIGPAPGGQKERFTLAVVDTGLGMTETEIQRLFNPYQQATDSTSRKFGGTGLGLAISRQYCRLMAGDLTVSSEPGKGSTFSATLPVQVAGESAAATLA